MNKRPLISRTIFLQLHCYKNESFSFQQRTRNKVDTKKSEIRQIDGRFLGSIQMRWNKSAALIDSNWWKKRRAGRGGQMSQRSPGQARFSDQWQKQILPNTMTNIKERWSDHGSLNKGWFSFPSARVRYVLAASFQTMVFICANSNFSPKIVPFDFHELI